MEPESNDVAVSDEYDTEWADSVDQKLDDLAEAVMAIAAKHNELGQDFTDVCAMLHAFASHTIETMARIFSEEQAEFGWGNPDLINEIVRKHNQLTQEVEDALNLHVDAHNALIDKTQQRTDMLADWLKEHDESVLAHSSLLDTLSRRIDYHREHLYQEIDIWYQAFSKIEARLDHFHWRLHKLEQGGVGDPGGLSPPSESDGSGYPGTPDT